MLIGLVTEEGEEEEGKSNSKVGTRWVRQTCLSSDIHDPSHSFFSFANFVSKQLTLDNPHTKHFITGKGDPPKPTDLT